MDASRAGLEVTTQQNLTADEFVGLIREFENSGYAVEVAAYTRLKLTAHIRLETNDGQEG